MGLGVSVKDFGLEGINGVKRVLLTEDKRKRRIKRRVIDGNGGDG